jgi:putative transposase
LQRWDDGWRSAGHRPAMASADALTQAFLWSEWRTVTKTATVMMHGNRYEVEPVLVGRKVELVFSPFDLAKIEVHHRGAVYGQAVPHRITRHTHPKARPETAQPPAAPATGIAYLQLVADTHHEQVAADERIGFHALYSTANSSTAGPETDQSPGQLPITDALREEAGT